MYDTPFLDALFTVNYKQTKQIRPHMCVEYTCVFNNTHYTGGQYTEGNKLPGKTSYNTFWTHRGLYIIKTIFDDRADCIACTYEILKQHRKGFLLWKLPCPYINVFAKIIVLLCGCYQVRTYTVERPSLGVFHKLYTCYL